MPEKSARLSAVSLRLAGEVGQRALDHVAASGTVGQADLDQHICAVRAAIAEYPMAGERQAAAIAGRAAVDARVGAAGRPGPGDLLSAIARSCPDVPFVADASSPEESVPLALLLHYLCGFIEEAVTRDWWPEPDPAEPDWESLRIAAVCHLVSQAEAAAELHPDLHPPALAAAPDDSLRHQVVQSGESGGEAARWQGSGLASPWDASIPAGRDDPAYRMTIFGDGSGLLSFHADDAAEIIRIWPTPRLPGRVANADSRPHT